MASPPPGDLRQEPTQRVREGSACVNWRQLIQRSDGAAMSSDEQRSVARAITSVRAEYRIVEPDQHARVRSAVLKALRSGLSENDVDHAVTSAIEKFHEPSA